MVRVQAVSLFDESIFFTCQKKKKVENNQMKNLMLVKYNNTFIQEIKEAHL